MKSIKSLQECLTLKKVSTLHNHTHMDSEISDMERTTSYECSQLGRMYDINFRRTSTSSRGDTPKPQRRNSFVTFETDDQSLSVIHLKLIQNPLKYIQMNELQCKLWKTLTKCQNIESVYLIDVIVLLECEYEFKFDLSQLSCFMTMKELAEQINCIYFEQKNNKLVNPALYILVGVIKTQKLDGEMRMFELLNILLNGKKTLILQSQIY